ncbi:uracil-DNA glycosylase family protein [Isoptericola luteus]|uniref:uracil-DNA glycosylase family protein n=1 Tax=Isoptericola luteus TaxID=2879484 RepID=UPI001CE1E1A5|nr:uracil-DNA glycosylase family protein [Isoptericola sp. NEAU-Y5]
MPDAGCRTAPSGPTWTPAGRVLADALTLHDAGLDPGMVHLTNAVKHFRHVEVPERGKRRLHRTPAVAHVRACLPWIRAETSAVRPQVVVALGGTAASAVPPRVLPEPRHPPVIPWSDAVGTQDPLVDRRRKPPRRASWTP